MSRLGGVSSEVLEVRAWMFIRRRVGTEGALVNGAVYWSTMIDHNIFVKGTRRRTAGVERYKVRIVRRTV